MLEYAKIKYLQSHLNSYLEFHPKSNCIIGENHSGKTAIMRAIIALTLNPRGYYSSLKRYGRWPYIEIGWSGNKIIRDREGYQLNNQRFKAVGDKVPLEIAHVLNLHEINFKPIREELFLISISSGARARLINKATGLASQEVLTAFCKSNIRECTDEIKIKEHLRTSLIAEISRLSPVEELENNFKTVDNEIERIEEIENRFNEISEIVANVEALDEILSRERKFLSLKAKVEMAANLEKGTLEVSEKINAIGFLVTEIEKYNQVLEREELIRKMDEQIGIVKKTMDAYKELEAAIDDLGRIVEGYVDSEMRMHRCIDGAEKAKEHRDKVMEELGICPLCKSDLRRK